MFEEMCIIPEEEEDTSQAMDSDIKEIAHRWGTSQTLVVQVREKLKSKLLRFCKDNGYEIKNNKFIQIK